MKEEEFSRQIVPLITCDNADHVIVTVEARLNLPYATHNILSHLTSRIPRGHPLKIASSYTG